MSIREKLFTNREKFPGTWVSHSAGANLIDR